MTKRITACPGWLELSSDRTSFVLSPERTSLVRLIFDPSIAGLGAYSIAKRLGVKGVPTFGSSKSWDPSTITNLLRNRATVGEFEPKQYRNGKVVAIGDPIRDYYPAVTDEETFQRARDASRENFLHGRGRKGRLLTNLFAGIPKCLYCGAPIKFHSNGDAKSFICSTVLDGRGCFRTGWSCSDFELSFFSFVEHNKVDADLQALLRSHRVANRQNAGAQILELRIGIAALLKSKIIRLAVASSGPSPQPTELEGRIRRNAPGRYFQLQFKGGPVHSVYPPQPRRGPGLDRVHLANALNLSPRQADITTLLAEGLSLTQLAEELDIGLETARWHLREVFRRTNTHSQAELPARASKTYGAATDGVQSGRT